MSLSSLSLAIIGLNTAVSQTILCVWNSIDNWDHLNGAYIYEGEYDTDEAQGRNSYWKRSSPSCPDPEQYIFAAYNSMDELHYWTIYHQLQAAAVFDYPDCGNDYALSPPFPPDPSQCQGGWTQFSNNRIFIPLPLTVDVGECPSLPCGEIQVTGSGDSHCDHIFTKYNDTDHVYIYNNTYLYFNPYTFRWYCSDILDQDNCNNDTEISDYYLSSKVDEWKDVSSSGQFQLTMSNNNTATFDCVPTPEPTQNPHDSIASVTVTPQVTSKQDIDCGADITENDICEIDCNLNDPTISNLYCRNAKLCIIRCTNDWCLWDTEIHAENAGNLQFVSSATSCVQKAALYLPNAGNASIVADTLGTEKNVLQSFSIHAGAATDHISIQCNSVENSGLTKDCVSVTLDAADARFVSIEILHAEYVGDASNPAVIQCPVDSALSPSCVINATYAVSTAFMAISAEKGIPQDVVFYSEGSGIYDSTTITCLNGVSTMQNDNTFIGTPCYVSSTSMDPTQHPSILPSYSPITTTANPTQSETSVSPTDTEIPTILPSIHASTSVGLLSSSITSRIPDTSSISDTSSTSNTVISQSYLDIRMTLITTRILSGVKDDFFTMIGANIPFLALIFALFASAPLLCGCYYVFSRNRDKRKAEDASETASETGSGSRKPADIVATPPRSHLVPNALDRVVSYSGSGIINAEASVSQKVCEASPKRELHKQKTTAKDLVEHWLSTTVGKPQYLDMFLENGYETMHIIETIQDKTQLSDIGITMKGHQALIMVEIDKLREQNENDEEIEVIDMDIEVQNDEAPESENTHDINDKRDVVGEVGEQELTRFNSVVSVDEYSDSNSSLYEVQNNATKM